MNCSLIQRPREKKGGKRYHVHTTEDDDPSNKVAKEYESSDEEYVLISALTRIVTHGNDIWYVDNGDSNNMTCYKNSLSNLTHKDSPHKVKLGDDYQYLIKGVGEVFTNQNSSLIQCHTFIVAISLSRKCHTYHTFIVTSVTFTYPKCHILNETIKTLATTPKTC
jgi:hypothetical protein